jgi:hypothetical protein
MVRALHTSRDQAVEGRGMGRSDAVEFEAGLLEERAVLGLGALLAFGQGEHADVECFAEVKGVAFGPDHLDDEQPAAGGHGTMAVGEDDGGTAPRSSRGCCSHTGSA